MPHAPSRFWVSGSGSLLPHWRCLPWAHLAGARWLRRPGLHAPAGDVPVVAEAPVAERDARAPSRRREVERFYLSGQEEGVACVHGTPSYTNTICKPLHLPSSSSNNSPLTCPNPSRQMAAQYPIPL